MKTSLTLIIAGLALLVIPSCASKPDTFDLSIDAAMQRFFPAQPNKEEQP